MSLRLWNGFVLVAVAGLWLASGTQREKRVLANTPSTADTPSEPNRALETLETRVAESPADSVSVRKLAQAYLDAQAPGLAVAAITRAPVGVRLDPRVEHVYARALLDQGRAEEALAAERRVLATCTMADSICNTWLTASAMRRAEILQELVQLGVEDAQAEPEAIAVAYHSVVRSARIE